MKATLVRSLHGLLLSSTAGLGNPLELSPKAGKAMAPNAAYLASREPGTISSLWGLVAEDDAEEQQAQCDADICTCISPKSLYKIAPETSIWGCSECPGVCPDGDFARGGRPDHPDLIPEVNGYAPGECGIHITTWPVPDSDRSEDSQYGFPILLMEFVVKDANTKEYPRHTVAGKDLTPRENPIADPFGKLLYYIHPGTFKYGDQTTSFDGSQTIPGVHACSVGEPDENGISQADCGFHCY